MTQSLEDLSVIMTTSSPAASKDEDEETDLNVTQRYIFTDQIVMLINLYKFVSYGTPHSSEGKEQIVNFPGFWGFFLT